jgi:hypothetical protein
MATLNKKIVLTLPPLMFDDMKRIAEIAGKSQQSIYRSAIKAMIADPQLILSQERSQVEKSLSDAFSTPKETVEEYVESEWHD